MNIEEGEWSVGLIERVDYAMGGAGNHWTNIDGVCYATYFDPDKVKVEVGETILYRTYKACLLNRTPVIHAEIRNVFR